MLIYCHPPPFPTRPHAKLNHHDQARDNPRQSEPDTRRQMVRNPNGDVKDPEPSGAVFDVQWFSHS
jgi:hypothetical protein